ncbi:hypothetical protein PMAYCL1PPCAC_05883, partial [Pristionchus mayeri]
KRKFTFLVISNTKINYPALIFGIGSALLSGFVILFMILQLIWEIKHGMAHASSSTKRYQKRAVFSLIMQGTVPNVIFVFPSVSMLSLFLYTMAAGAEEAARNQSGT